jgi:hypothetical protein
LTNTNHIKHIDLTQSFFFKSTTGVLKWLKVTVETEIRRKDQKNAVWAEIRAIEQEKSGF